MVTSSGDWGRVLGVVPAHSEDAPGAASLITGLFVKLLEPEKYSIQKYSIVKML